MCESSGLTVQPSELPSATFKRQITVFTDSLWTLVTWNLLVGTTLEGRFTVTNIHLWVELKERIVTSEWQWSRIMLEMWQSMAPLSCWLSSDWTYKLVRLWRLLQHTGVEGRKHFTHKQSPGLPSAVDTRFLTTMYNCTYSWKENQNWNQLIFFPPSVWVCCSWIKTDWQRPDLQHFRDLKLWSFIFCNHACHLPTQQFCGCSWLWLTASLKTLVVPSSPRDTADKNDWRNVRTFLLKKYFHIIYNGLLYIFIYTRHLL